MALSSPVSAQIADQPIINGSSVTFTGPNQTVDQDFGFASFWTGGFDGTYTGTITEGFFKSDEGRLLLTAPLAYSPEVHTYHGVVVGGILAGSGEVFAGRSILLAEQGRIEITGGTFSSEVTGSGPGIFSDLGILITGTVEITTGRRNPFYGPTVLRNGANLTVRRPPFLYNSSAIDIDGTSTYTFPEVAGIVVIPVIVANGATFHSDFERSAIDAPISGGVWNKTGTGKLTLGWGATDNSAGVNVRAGTLSATYASMPRAVAVSDGARVEFYRPIPQLNGLPDGTYAGSITGLGAMDKTGSNALTLTGSHNYAGGTTIQDGELHIGNGGTTGSLTGDIVNDGRLVFNRQDDVVFAGAISGSGSLAKAGAGKLTLNGNHAYEGDTTVSAGTLLVNGASNQSHFIVNAAGTLGGNGTVQSVLVKSGGALAAGNSIGTFDIAGDLNLGSGSTLRVEADASHADRVNVGGVATITGAKLFIIADKGANYVPGATYTILSSSNPVIGQFASVAKNFAFLDASLDYTTNPNAVALTLTRNAVNPGQIAITANQRAAAQAFTEFSPDDPVYQALMGLSTDSARQVYDDASGELHASAPYISGQTFGAFQSLMQTGAPGSVSGAQSAPIAYGPAAGTAVASLLAIDEAAASAPAPVTSAWLTPVAGRGSIETDGNAAAIDWAVAGLVGGFETSSSFAGGTINYGLATGYVSGWASAADRASDLSSAGGYFGAYTGWTDGVVSLKGNVAYGAEHITTTRDITVGAIGRTATAQYWNQTVGIGVQASYAYHLTEAFTVGPVASVDVKWSGHNGFSETGAGSLNATVDGASAVTIGTGLGIELDYMMALATGGTVALTGRAVWQHDHGGKNEQTLRLAGGGPEFSITAPDTGRDRLQLGTGITYRPGDKTEFSLDYVGSFSGNITSHGITAGLKVAF